MAVPTIPHVPGTPWFEGYAPEKIEPIYVTLSLALAMLKKFEPCIACAGGIQGLGPVSSALYATIVAAIKAALVLAMTPAIGSLGPADVEWLARYILKRFLVADPARLQDPVYLALKTALAYVEQAHGCLGCAIVSGADPQDVALAETAYEAAVTALGTAMILYAASWTLDDADGIAISQYVMAKLQIGGHLKALKDLRDLGANAVQSGTFELEVRTIDEISELHAYMVANF